MLGADENHPFQALQVESGRLYSDAFLSGGVEKRAPLSTSFPSCGDEASSSLLQSVHSTFVRASDLLSSLNEANTKSTSHTSHPTEVSTRVNFLRSVAVGLTATSDSCTSGSLSPEIVHLKKVVHFEEARTNEETPRLSDSRGLMLSDASDRESSTGCRTVLNSSIHTATDTITDEHSTDALHCTRAEGNDSTAGGTSKNVQYSLPPSHSVPLSFPSQQTSADAADPLGGWRDLLRHHPPSFFDPSTANLKPSTVLLPSGRQTDIEEEIVKERAVRDYLRRLMIFSRGYDDPSFFASGVPLNLSLGMQRSPSSAAASSRSPTSLWFEDGLYNGAAMGQLIQTILMWLKSEPILTQQCTPNVIPAPTLSFSVFLNSIPSLPPHRFPQSISEVRENYQAFITFLTKEDGSEKDAVLKVPADILQQIQVEEVYTHHRRAPLLELFTHLIREYLPPPEQIPFFLRILSHQLPVDACVGSFPTATRECSSSFMKENSLENLSAGKEKKEEKECGACSSSSFSISLVQRQLSTYAAYERFLCQFLVTHFALPDPETYSLPSDDCLIPGPLHANFLFSHSSSLPHRSSAPSASSSVAPPLSSLFLAVEEPFVPRHSPPLALFVPSVFPFLTNGVSLLKLAATLRPPSSVHTVRERGTDRFKCQRSPTVSPHLLSSWRHSCLNPKTPLRCQLNIAIALQWLLTDERGRLIASEKDFGLDHREEFYTTSGFTRTSVSGEDPAGGKGSTLFAYGSATRSKSILDVFHRTISRIANCIYQGDRLCLLKVLWSAVEFHRRASLARTGVNDVASSPVRSVTTDVNSVSSAPQSANAKMHSTSPKEGSLISLKPAQGLSWFTSPSSWMHTLPSALKVEKELQRGFASSSFSDRAPLLHTFQGNTGEQLHLRSHSVARRGKCGHQRTLSRQRTESVRRREHSTVRQGAQETTLEAVAQKLAEVDTSVPVGAAASPSSSRAWADREVQQLKDWFLSVVGGPRFYYEARDNSFRIQGSNFELPIPAFPRTSTASPSPKCLILSDGVVLAQLIRILERRRCDALDCVKPAIQKAAKRFNISRCIRFLREDCGVTSSILWILEEPLLDGDIHAVLSLLKILKKHYNRYGTLQQSISEE